MAEICHVDNCTNTAKYVRTVECTPHYRQRNKPDFKGYRQLGYRTSYNQECEVPNCKTLTKMARLCTACRKKTTRYNLTTDEVIALPTSCEVCHSIDRLHVDHDHTTSNYRGVLCGNCNTALGLLDEDRGRMEKLIEYVKTHKAV